MWTRGKGDKPSESEPKEDPRRIGQNKREYHEYGHRNHWAVTKNRLRERVMKDLGMVESWLRGKDLSDPAINKEIHRLYDA